jgi:hypothetical protein
MSKEKKDKFFETDEELLKEFLDEGSKSRVEQFKDLFVQKEEDKPIKLTREQFRNECEKSLALYGNMAQQYHQQAKIAAHLLNETSRIEADPSLRVEYFLDEKRKGLFFKTKPKRFGFGKK